MTYDHVLVARKVRSGDGSVFHLPDPDDPDRPDCRHGGRYRRVDRDVLGDHFRICRYCDPETDVDHDNPRHGAKETLLAMDPEEIGAEGSA